MVIVIIMIIMVLVSKFKLVIKIAVIKRLKLLNIIDLCLKSV